MFDLAPCRLILILRPMMWVNFYLSTYGNVNTTTIGELHVRYRVRFSKPVLEAAGSANQSGSYSLFTSVAAGEVSTGGSQIKFADAVFNPLGIVNTAGSFALPPGAYLIETSLTDTTGNSNFSVDLLTSSSAKSAGPLGQTGLTPCSSTTSWVSSATTTVTLTIFGNGSTSGDVVHGWVRITFLQAAPLSALPPVETEYGFQSEELAAMRKQLQDMQEFLAGNKWGASVQPAGDSGRLKRKVYDESDTSEEEDSTVKLSQSMVGRLTKVLAGGK